MSRGFQIRSHWPPSEIDGGETILPWGGDGLVSLSRFHPALFSTSPGLKTGKSHPFPPLSFHCGTASGEDCVSPQRGPLLPLAQTAGLGLWDALEVGVKPSTSLSGVTAIQTPSTSIISVTRQPAFVEIFTRNNPKKGHGAHGCCLSPFPPHLPQSHKHHSNPSTISFLLGT